MADVNQNAIDIQDLQAWRDSVNAKKKTASQILDSTTPTHILVNDGGEVKKVVGIPAIIEVTATDFIIKLPDGTVVMEIGKPI